MNKAKKSEMRGYEEIKGGDVGIEEGLRANLVALGI